MSNMVENQFQKWVNLVLIILGALVAFIFYEAFLRVVSLYDLETRVKNIDVVAQFIALGLGAVAFAVARWVPQSNTFLVEVAEELSKVTWPTQKETTGHTWVVIVMVVVAGIILGALDYVWTRLLQWIL
jgi:preprotein translocase subunit SecE